jgi:hypothetical protein
MGKFEFTLVIAGDVMPDTVIDALFETGCDDATFSGGQEASLGVFHRESSTFGEAAASAIGAVESVPGLVVQRIEPDDLVTLSEIAQRLGRTRESVRLLVAGARGPGAFPAPISHLRTRNRLWRWSDVAAWAGVATPQQVHDAKLIAALNAALELRHALQALAPAEDAEQQTEDVALAIMGDIAAQVLPLKRVPIPG